MARERSLLRLGEGLPGGGYQQADDPEDEREHDANLEEHHGLFTGQHPQGGFSLVAPFARDDCAADLYEGQVHIHHMVNGGRRVPPHRQHGSDGQNIFQNVNHQISPTVFLFTIIAHFCSLVNLYSLPFYANYYCPIYVNTV